MALRFLLTDEILYRLEPVLLEIKRRFSASAE